METIKSIVKSVLNAYPQWVCRKEFKHQTLRFNERPIEYGFVFRKLSALYPKTILDVGTGTTALPHLMRNCGFLVTATDNVRDYWSAGMFNRHYHVIDDDITRTRLTGTFDLVTCISVLEHIQSFDKAIQSIVQRVKPGGHILLTFPYSEQAYVRNVYDLPGSSYGRGSPYITQSFSRVEISAWMLQHHLILEEQECWRCWSGAHWTVGQQVIPPVRVHSNELHQLTCIHFIKVADTVQHADHSDPD